MSSEAVIRINDISKSYEMYDKPHHRLFQMIFNGRKKFYKDFWALRDISFDILKGECVGIVGRNGSGKSTLLEVIAGTLMPTSGNVEIKGRVAALLELGSGFNPEFSGRENVYINGTVLGLSQKEIDEKFENIAAFADIGEFIDQPVKTYSSGMALRLVFAVMAHVDADILIIDEALAVGDAFFTQKCMRFLREFMEEKTVLFVSHDISAVVNLCTKAYLLEDGCLKFSGSPSEVAEYYLESIVDYLQEDVKISKRKTKAASSSTIKTVCRDMRQDFINSSNLRNDIEVFSFNESSNSFGEFGAKIKSMYFTDEDGKSLSWIVGGENVVLKIVCESSRELDTPIAGFHLKDRLGQYIFGDNTYLTYCKNRFTVEAGKEFEACFHFRMPTLPSGEYCFNCAVAEGSQDVHAHHHWIHDALVIKSHSSRVVNGLFCVDMSDIKIDIRE